MMDEHQTERGRDEHLLDFSAYRNAVTEAVVSLDVHSAQRDDFRGNISASATGDIHVFDIDADSHSVHRTPALIARSRQQYLKFSLIQRGNGLLVQDGRETALGAGDMAIYDTDRPYSLLFDDAMRMSVVMFPKTLLDMPIEAVGRLTATRLNGSDGVGALIRPYLSSLTRDTPALDAHITRRLLRTAVEMVGTLLEANSDRAGGAHDVIMRRILDYIDDHLDDKDLTPGRIADAHFISVRHLHSLFSDQESTVSTVIRTRRLERCYDEIVDPSQAHRSITTIALSNGFVDPAHFSRTFRAHFGASPSAVRADRG